MNVRVISGSGTLADPTGGRTVGFGTAPRVASVGERWRCAAHLYPVGGLGGGGGRG